MKVKDLFMWGRPAFTEFTDEIANDLGSWKRARRFIVIFVISCWIVIFATLNAAFGFIPSSLYYEDVSWTAKSLKNMSREEQQQFLIWLNSLPYHSDQPWYDIFDITGRTSPRP